MLVFFFRAIYQVAFEDSGYTGIESVTQAKNLEYNVEFAQYVRT